MTSGELIELRLAARMCIKCGLNAAIDWPYICPDCIKQMAAEGAAKRKRLDAKESDL